MSSNNPVTPDTMITVKVLFGGETRRFRIPLRELGASSLPGKLHNLLSIPAGRNVVFERYSDSNARYIVLNTNEVAVWKQLWRAAKAKLKLRLKVTVLPAPEAEEAKEEPASSPVSPPQLSNNRFEGSASNTTTAAGSMAPPPPPTKRGDDVIKSIIAGAQKQAMYQFNNPSEATLRPEPASKVITSLSVKEPEDEAPVPRAFVDRSSTATKAKPTVLRGCDQAFNAPLTAFTVQCNNCDENIADTHWHCSICEDNDFDLCPSCIEFGVHCQVDSHFLIKRSIDAGRVVNSTVETAVPRKASSGPAKSVKIEEPEKEIPGAFTEAKDEALPESLEMTRTCNSCVNSFDETNFVTCLVCEDYDLCLECHVGLKHGHDPSHRLAPVLDAFAMDHEVSALCAPGRNVRHFASCDGCDKTIFGVRHKCLACPDFDYCSTCHASAAHIHPGHRFVPLYDTIAMPCQRAPTHYSIRCDGPLCAKKMNFIRGDRYKCAVCDDVDFCASCEALPTNPHNRSHPLIKVRLPVRHLGVTTYNEGGPGETTVTVGDRIPTRSRSTETTPAAASANAATQVQTVAEVKPEPVTEERKEAPAFNVFEAKAKPVVEKPSRARSAYNVKQEAAAPPPPQLEAHFVRDTITDNTVMAPGDVMEQTWVLRNPGPAAWPAGCCVRYIGGDAMLNVDGDRPASVAELDRACQSNTMAMPVLPGLDVYFTVAIRAPQREGKAISYWRLKAPDGTPFGHKLWCDITVQKPAPKPEEVAAQPAGHESQMVFPTLDKESPAASEHEAATAAAEPAAAPSTAAPSTAGDGLEEDLESLGLDDDDETDDCCLTDEEYDIIDDAESEEAANGKN